MLLGNFQKKARQPEGGHRLLPAGAGAGRRAPGRALQPRRRLQGPGPARRGARGLRAGARARPAQRQGALAARRPLMRKGEPAKAEAVIQDALARKVDEHRFLLKLGESQIEAKRSTRRRRRSRGPREEARPRHRPLQPRPRLRGAGPDRRGHRRLRGGAGDEREGLPRVLQPGQAAAEGGAALARPWRTTGRRWSCSPTSAPASSTWPRPCSTRGDLAGRRAVGAQGPGRASPTRASPRSATTCWPTCYNRQGRERRRPTARSAAAARASSQRGQPE